MNRKISLIFQFLIIFFSLQASAQIENVIVETYYVSDNNDATDTIGGILEPGSTTYRVYIDLVPGCRLKKIYGDATHTLRFSSTAPFWNNLDRGQTFGNDFSKSWLDEGTVALDSYLAIGQTTKNGASTYFGILKTQDTDGSFIGGVNNDGGWSGIPDGLIANQDSAAGIPVTLADGMDTLADLPTNWIDDGIVDGITGDDSTIFGSLKVDSEFVSNNASLQNSGVMGIMPGSNQILIAQLTTKGEISFELNVVIEEPTIPNPTEVIYVAKLAPGESETSTFKLSPYLTYPAQCGCSDAHYLEYSNAFACNDQSACKTLIVYGCMDTMACNYDPAANFNIAALCCYPGYCGDRNLAVICPSLNNERLRIAGSKLYPDPAQREITLEIPEGENAQIEFDMHNYLGEMVVQKNFGSVSGSVSQKMDLDGLPSGLYILHLKVGSSSDIIKFIKN